MPTSSFLKAVSAGAMLWAPLAFGTSHSTLTDTLATDGVGDAKKVKVQKALPTKRTTRMFESLKPVDSKLPDTARRDASAGVFI